MNDRYEDEHPEREAISERLTIRLVKWLRERLVRRQVQEITDEFETTVVAPLMKKLKRNDDRS